MGERKFLVQFENTKLHPEKWVTEEIVKEDAGSIYKDYMASINKKDRARRLLQRNEKKIDGDVSACEAVYTTPVKRSAKKTPVKEVESDEEMQQESEE